MDEKSDVGPERITHHAETVAVPPATTIHLAELATGPSGAVEYGLEIDEHTAVALRRNGEDIVFRGTDTIANRAEPTRSRPRLDRWASPNSRIRARQG